MKKILFLLLVFPFLVHGQGSKTPSRPIGVYEYQWLYSDSVLAMPQSCGAPTGLPLRSAICRDTCNQITYVFDIHTKLWYHLSDGTSGIFLPISDTASMLSPYIRAFLAVKYGDTAAMLASYAKLFQVITPAQLNTTLTNYAQTNGSNVVPGSTWSINISGSAILGTATYILQSTTPKTPVSGAVVVFVDSVGNLAYRTSAGNIIEFAALSGIILNQTAIAQRPGFFVDSGKHHSSVVDSTSLFQEVDSNYSYLGTGGDAVEGSSSLAGYKRGRYIYYTETSGGPDWRDNHLAFDTLGVMTQNFYSTTALGFGVESFLMQSAPKYTFDPLARLSGGSRRAFDMVTTLPYNNYQLVSNIQSGSIWGFPSPIWWGAYAQTYAAGHVQDQVTPIGGPRIKFFLDTNGNYMGAPYINLDTASFLSSNSSGIFIKKHIYPSIITLPDIQSLEAYAGAQTLIFVSDTLRGGLFGYQTNGTLDSGKVFNAWGKGSGFWVRSIDNGYNANPWWYGLKPNTFGDTTGAHKNAIALRLCVQYNHNVLIPSGVYYLDSTIFISSGCNIGGTHAPANSASGQGGSVLIMNDSLGCISYVNNGDINAQTWIHDLTMYGIGSGVNAHGIIVARGFYFLERLNVQGFGGDGIHITSTYAGVNTIADDGTVQNCLSQGNNGNGFYIGGGADNNNCNFIKDQAASNLGSGWFLLGGHHVLENNNASANYKYAFDDEGSSNVHINDYVEGGRGDTILLNGLKGVFIAGNYFGAGWVLAGNNMNTWTLDMGADHGINQTWSTFSSTWNNGKGGLNSDSVFNVTSTQPGQATFGALIGGTPNGGAVNVDGVSGTLGFTGLQFLTSTPLWSDYRNGRILWNNTGISGSPYSYAYNNMYVFGTTTPPPGISTYMTTTAPYDQISKQFTYSIAPYSPSGIESEVDLNVFDARSNNFAQKIAALEISTSYDTAAYNHTVTGLNIQPNAHLVKIYGDTLHGDMQFKTFGTTFNSGLGNYYATENNGGNFVFFEQDGNPQIVANTFNRSTFVNNLKINKTTPTATSTDSVLVFEPSDSSARKELPNTILSNYTNFDTTVTANYTATNAYARTTIFVNATSATVTLPDPTQAVNRRRYFYVRPQTTGQTVTIATAAGQIESSLGVLSATVTITAIPYQGWISNGTNWLLSN